MNLLNSARRRAEEAMDIANNIANRAESLLEETDTRVSSSGLLSAMTPLFVADPARHEDEDEEESGRIRSRRTWRPRAAAAM